MSKPTIFGEEHFFDSSMIVLEYNRAVEQHVYDKFSGAIEMALPNVRIDKEKLIRWIKLCQRLDNLSSDEVTDIALKKKIADLENQLAEKEKALEELRNFKVVIGVNEHNKIDISKSCYVDYTPRYLLDKERKKYE